MNPKVIRKTLVATMACTLLMPVLAAAADAVDAEAAEALARQENCLKCHGIDKRKSAPPYTQIAKKYAGKPDAEARLLKHIQSGDIVTVNDEEEQHRIPKTKDEAALRNLIRWILSR